MTAMPTIDFNNIIKHALIKATEYSVVHGGSLTLTQSSGSSVRSTSSTSSSSSSSGNQSPKSAESPSQQQEDSGLKPVVLKTCRHPSDFRDLLHAYTKLRDYPQSSNIVVFYGATREYSSATTSAGNKDNNNAPPAKTSGTGTLGSIAASIASLSLTTSTSGTTNGPNAQQELASPRDWIVTKPAGKGTLYEYLKSPQGVALDWMDRIRLMRGVVNGLLHLHEHGLLHMNLHSDNVLVENGPVAVLTDFGQITRSTRGPESAADPTPAGATGTQAKSSARWVHSGGVYEKGLTYTAPERISNPALNPCTAASDIYSLGVVMLEILTGHRSSASQFLASASSAEGHHLLSETEEFHSSLPTISTPHGSVTVPRALESLIRRMCSRDPAQRPNLLMIRSQLKEMANTSFDLHVREPINKNTTGIQLNAKKPLSMISVVTTPSVMAGMKDYD
ncbi:kinase-like domain-containing protein [Mortierella sp. GBAus27b]|nr:kinase-like domain-containing protein [Mortierella sp. GBAus27b]